MENHVSFYNICYHMGTSFMCSAFQHLRKLQLSRVFVLRFSREYINTTFPEGQNKKAFLVANGDLSNHPVKGQQTPPRQV